VYGVRPTRIFRQAATKYLQENLHKRAIGRDAQDLKSIDSYIGDLPLHLVHHDALKKFIEARRSANRKSGTINRTLAVVRRVLNLSARLWPDQNGLSWLQTAPMIQLLPPIDKRKPYPLSWAEQSLMFRQLPKHLHEMALFKCNTGCREQEVCQLQWDWEVPVPELDTSVFEIPDWLAKNGEARIVVLNSVARRVVEAQRGVHPTHVFTFDGRPLTKIHNSGWERARRDAANAYLSELGGGVAMGFSQPAGARSEAHVRAAVAKGRRELRGSPGSAGAQGGQGHHRVFSSGDPGPDRGCGEGDGRAKTQKPHNAFGSRPQGCGKCLI
jgi:integrase